MVPRGAWSCVPDMSGTGVLVPLWQRKGVRMPEEVVLYGL